MRRGPATEADFRIAYEASKRQLHELADKRQFMPAIKAEIMGGTLRASHEPCRTMDAQVFEIEDALAKMPIPNRACPLAERGLACNCIWTAWMPDWPPRRKRA